MIFIGSVITWTTELAFGSMAHVFITDITAKYRRHQNLRAPSMAAQMRSGRRQIIQNESIEQNILKSGVKQSFRRPGSRVRNDRIILRNVATSSGSLLQSISLFNLDSMGPTQRPSRLYASTCLENDEGRYIRVRVS